METRNSQMNRESFDACSAPPSAQDSIMLAQEEQRLLQRLFQGDPDAMEKLYESNVDAIYRWFLSRTRERAEAENLTSDTFTRALEALMGGKYTWKAPVITWLFGIARNVYREWCRAKPPTTSVEELDGDQQLSGDENDLFTDFWQRETSKSLWRVVNRLPLDEQKILRWRFVYDLSYVEISRRLGISPAACKQKNYRAIQWLRQNIPTRDFDGNE